MPKRRLFTALGKSQSLSKWATETGIPFHTLYARVHILGWDLERAIGDQVRGTGGLRVKYPSEYTSWNKMMSRCHYGKVGKNTRIYREQAITVCPQWRDFVGFFADMGIKPTAAHTIDRIDGAKGYEPGNCRWATRLEQTINRKVTILLTHQGETLPIKDWSKRFGVPAKTIYDRVAYKGWEHSRAITDPPCRTGRPPSATRRDRSSAPQHPPA